MAYIYNADIYCDDCGESICRRITEEGNAPDDPEDHYSFNSDEYPKQVDGTAEADSPQHCGAGGVCLNSIDFGDKWNIGAWLENDLTTDGQGYVVEAVREGREGQCSNDVTELWAEWYDYLDFTVYYMCEGCGRDFDVDDVDEDNYCEGCRECDDDTLT